ncbi:hypothetical protein MMMB2_4588 [Mycobacterium marinum MB2]|nr:hypothetical protein MMSP_5209 [Mycobacterium sp. 012931]EPQ73816.1 hypothetical protein MMMB2_4588 [Mycobacterium marinum MB2]
MLDPGVEINVNGTVPTINPVKVIDSGSTRRLTGKSMTTSEW